jgi:hypothetical protein
MIRQAQTYLVSAMSGATVIAIAIVAFVLLVSIQVFHDWPIAALGGDGPHISDSRATSAPTAQAVPTGSKATAAAASPAQGDPSHRTGADGGATADPTQVSEGSLAPSAGPTATTSPVDNGNGEQGSDSPSSSPGQSQSGTGSGKSGSGASSSAGGSGSGGGGKSAATTTTGKVTEAVNETVNQVDQGALGGTLEKTGVTQVTEGVVNGVVGPESTVGKVVDGTVESVGKTVGGLLGGKH